MALNACSSEEIQVRTEKPAEQNVHTFQLALVHCSASSLNLKAHVNLNKLFIPPVVLVTFGFLEKQVLYSHNFLFLSNYIAYLQAIFPQKLLVFPSITTNIFTVICLCCSFNWLSKKQCIVLWMCSLPSQLTDHTVVIWRKRRGSSTPSSSSYQ